MINKIMKEYVEQEIHNKDINFKNVLLRRKGVINMRKVLNVAVILLVVIFVGTVSSQIYAKIQWNIEFKEYQNRDYKYGSGILKEAVESGYNEEVEMEYVEQDGIKCKVDSLLITDDYFGANINFVFDEDKKINSTTFDFGYAVYDDEKNVYGISTRMHLGKNEKRDNYTIYLYEDIGVKYNKKDIYAVQCKDSSSSGNISAVNGNIISSFNFRSSKGFPKSKKIYIRIFDLGYSMTNLDVTGDKPKYDVLEDFSASDAEWIFEIDVPEKFYNRESIQMKLSEEIPDVVINKINVTETGLVVEGTIKNLEDIILTGKDMTSEEWRKRQNELINITDNDGNVYNTTDMGTTTEKDGFKCKFEISKDIVNSKQLFLNMRINENSYTRELGI